MGGVHPPENKITAAAAIVPLPLPTQISVPLAQNLGAPSKALVKKGDAVKTGQLIAKGEAFISANIHSPVSGTVLKLDDVINSSGYKQAAITIKVEGDEWEEHIDRSETLLREISLTKDEIVSKIKDLGIVGLGGATFPSHVKLMVPDGKRIETLIINGVECEPYLTADDRLMIERTEEVLTGTLILMKGLDVKRALIGIEANKPEALASMREAAVNYPGIEVHALKVKYPQGGEKQLIKALTGREVPSGKLPLDVGCVVNNVGTAFAVYEAIQKNKPLIERVVTLTGSGLKNPGNFLVRIGTPVSLLVEQAGGLPESAGKIINGGPMMGKALTSLDVPVVKGTSGILILSKEESRRLRSNHCIRCSKCISACPMGLEPYLLANTAKQMLWEKTEQARIMDCIECGSCQYTCPSSLPLLDYLRVGKIRVGQIIRNRRN
jgi:electron transport complex protein RnfC